MSDDVKTDILEEKALLDGTPLENKTHTPKGFAESRSK